MSNHESYPTAEITADSQIPAIRIRRDFNASVAQVHRAHADPALVTQWMGPNGGTVSIDVWDFRPLGSYRYLVELGGESHAFRGTFPDVRPDRIVQTFCWEGMPDEISLETMLLADLGDGRTRVDSLSLMNSFVGRDAMLASGMDVGVNDGYAKLDQLLAAGKLN